MSLFQQRLIALRKDQGRNERGEFASGDGPDYSKMSASDLHEEEQMLLAQHKEGDNKSKELAALREARDNRNTEKLVRPATAKLETGKVYKFGGVRRGKVLESTKLGDKQVVKVKWLEDKK
jgi:hypothetical protein